MKNLIKLFFISFLFTNCGFFENDEIVFKEAIVGRFEIIKIGLSDDAILVFNDSPQNSSIIFGNVGQVVYNSINNKIYVENIVNKFYSDYYVLKIDLQETNVTTAFVDKQLTKKVFDESIKNCVNCITKNIPDGEDISTVR